MAALHPAALAARNVLERARLEFESLDEPWDGYRVDVELIAALLFELGIQEVPDLRVGQREYAAFLDGDARLIAVEARHHPHRRRFSIAHEIGHFVLHYQPQMRLFTCSSRDMDVGESPPEESLAPPEPGGGIRTESASSHRQRHLRQEFEANQFASELLMPEQPLRAIHRVTGGKLLAMARHFDVSPQAMEIRLERLQLPVRR